MLGFHSIRKEVEVSNLNDRLRKVTNKQMWKEHLKRLAKPVWKYKPVVHYSINPQFARTGNTLPTP